MAYTVIITTKSLKQARKQSALRFYNQDKLAAEAKVSRALVSRFLNKIPIKVGDFKLIVGALGLDLEESIDWNDFDQRYGDSAQDSEISTLRKLASPQDPERIGHWYVDKRLGPLEMKSNGLQYGYYRLRHKDREQINRGKRYLIEHLSTEERANIPTKIDRHCKVVNLLNEKYVRGVLFWRDAFCYPEDSENPREWWVIEHWVDGMTLAELMKQKHKQFSKREVLKIARHLLETLKELHALDVIVRDLSPESILIREEDGYPIILDFELAKLSSTTSTVSNPSLEETPFLAPELIEDAPNPELQADLYSWAMVILAVALNKPIPTKEDVALCSSLFSRKLFQELEKCLSPIYEKRPENADVILDTFPVIPSFLRLA